MHDASLDELEDGGYDDGYRSCPCFWGREPGRLVAELARRSSVAGMKALDLGCGEGKNAAYLAARGATVEAWDVSTLALENARKAWPQSPIEWQRRSATGLTRDQPEYDIIIAYGLLHCLPFDEIPSVLESMKAATAIGGYNIVVAFNDRLTISPAAHPGFQPSLRTHNFYVEYYRGWRLDLATDEDLAESHPNNGIPHVHAMTRLLAQRTDSRW